MFIILLINSLKTEHDKKKIIDLIIILMSIITILMIFGLFVYNLGTYHETEKIITIPSVKEFLCILLIIIVFDFYLCFHFNFWLSFGMYGFDFSRW